jgi:putative flippase GtrA
VLAAVPGLRPMLAVAAGSGVAMVVSYIGYSRFVFRPAKP